MSHHCGVPHCLSNSLKNPLKKYFRVPRVVSNKGERERRLSTFRRQVWITALARSRPDLSEVDLLQLEVCQDHFVSGKPSQYRTPNDKDWVPSVNLHPVTNEPVDNALKEFNQDDTMDKSRRQSDAKKAKLDVEIITPDSLNVVTELVAKVPNILQEMTSDFSYVEQAGSTDTSEEPQCREIDLIIEEPAAESTSLKLEVKEEMLFEIEELKAGALAAYSNLKSEKLNIPLGSEWLPVHQGSSENGPHEVMLIFNPDTNSVAGTSSSTTLEVDGTGTCTVVNNRSSPSATENSMNYEQLRKEYEKLKEKNQVINNDMQKLRNKTFLAFEINVDLFKKNDRLVELYTGLPTFDQLRVFYEEVAKLVPIPQSYLKIPRFNEFLLVLLKMRMNVTFDTIAERFKLDVETARTICVRWINGLYDWAKAELTWDDNNKLDTTTFTKFTDKYGNKVASILNVFEVQIPKPMNSEACMLTWSPVRDCYVIKYLLSVTPRGKINFLSDGWGGVVTDKQITEECGFLDFLGEGDQVMTDKGFVPQLDKLLEEMECGLIECNKSNKDSLFYVIDVEKRVKELFPILNNVIPMYLLTEKSEDGMPLIDKIANIGCAILNRIVAKEQQAEMQTKAAKS